MVYLFNISKTDRLKKIILIYNSLQLPREVGFLKKLWSLNFSGNPVNETLKSLLGDKMRVVKSVVSYLRSIMDE